MPRNATVLLTLSLLLALSACSGHGPAGLAAPETAPAQQQQAAWPTALPKDALQPWEQAGARRASSAAEGIVTAGVERFSAGAGSSASVSDLGEASELDSGASGSKQSAYAIYRIPVDSFQPGSIAVDVNPLARQGSGGPSSYYLGVADYGRSVWRWAGPFTDYHVRLGADLLPQGDYSSSVGDCFVCVLAYDGARADVVAVNVQLKDNADTTAPPTPTGLTLTNASAAIEAQWNSVLAGDLAGYRIYYSTAIFSNVHAPGVKSLPYLQELTHAVLPTGAGTFRVAVTAVDFSGNESAPCPVQALHCNGGVLQLTDVTVSAPSALRDEPLSVSLAGADSFDVDLDGDGVFELTGLGNGEQNIDTSRAGLLRVNVRASSGTAVAYGGVSVIVLANTRPAASAVATPSSGALPLNVTFTGEAEDSEDLPAALSYAWDFDGDGIYEANTNTLTPPVQQYAVAGFYNAKLRVTDSQGAWDTDTVGIQAGTGTGGSNQAPTAAIGTDVDTGNVPLTVHFNSNFSNDPDGSLVQYDWDFDNDGIWDAYDSTASVTHVYTSPGVYDIKLRVTDNGGLRATTIDSISALAVGNNPPVCSLLPVSGNGNVGFGIFFNASGSTAGGDFGDSIVKYEWDWDGNGSYDEYGTSPTIDHTFFDRGVFNVILRITDTAGNQATDSSSVTVGVLPTAVLTLVPNTVQLGETVLMSATGSGDQGGSITKYEWDSNGDGLFETDTGVQSSFAFTPSAVGQTSLHLRVTDNSGNTAAATAQLKVQGFNAPQTVDNNGSPGLYKSLAVINGNPAIAYEDLDSTHLFYIRANDPAGSSWGSPVPVDTGNLAGFYPSLAQVNGSPAIAYQDGGNSFLRFARATDVNGGAWGMPQTLDNNNGAGAYASLCVVSGNPAIGYTDTFNGVLHYIRASDPSGTIWGAIADVDSSNYNSSGVSLNVIGANPAMAFTDGSHFDLRYVRALDATGSSWDAALTVDGTGVTGIEPSLCMVSGNPAIAYQDQSNTELRYVRASDAAGGSWPLALSLDSLGDTGRSPSMALINGLPAIAYFDFTNLKPRYIRATDASGIAWALPVTLQLAGNAGDRPSLAFVNGGPAIAYYDETLTALDYIIGY